MRTITSAVLAAWRILRMPDWLRWFVVSSINQKFLVGAAVVVINEQNEVLLFHHTYRQSFAWGLPTGWLQRGESLMEAIEREVFEESSLRIRATRLLSVSAAHRVPRLDVVFEGEFLGGRFRPSAEVSDASFFPAGSLPPILVNQRTMIELAIETRQPVTDH